MGGWGWWGVFCFFLVCTTMTSTLSLLLTRIADLVSTNTVAAVPYRVVCIIMTLHHRGVIAVYILHACASLHLLFNYFLALPGTSC